MSDTLEIQNKNEVTGATEQTHEGRVFSPQVDIYEADEASKAPVDADAFLS